MSRLSNRISKLEQRSGIPDDVPAVFLVGWEGVDGSRECDWAIVLGVGDLHRAEDETEADLRRRAWAMHVAQKHPDDMTKEELNAALLAADVIIASKNKAEDNG